MSELSREWNRSRLARRPSLQSLGMTSSLYMLFGREGRALNETSPPSFQASGDVVTPSIFPVFHGFQLSLDLCPGEVSYSDAYICTAFQVTVF